MASDLNPWMMMMASIGLNGKNVDEKSIVEGECATTISGMHMH